MDFATLLQALREAHARGDREASKALFAQIHKRYAAQLRATALGCTSEQFRALYGPSDVVQDALLRIDRHLNRFRGQTEGEFRAWAARIVRNCAATVWKYFGTVSKAPHRGGQGKGEAQPDTAAPTPDARGTPRQPLRDPRALEAAPDPQPTPGTVAQYREEVQRTLGALGRLPPLQRQVLELQIFEDLSLSQIAERVECTVDQVRYALEVGRETLRRVGGR